MPGGVGVQIGKPFLSAVGIAVGAPLHVVVAEVGQVLCGAIEGDRQAAEVIAFAEKQLLHGGAHKTNQVLGQALLAKRMGKTRIIAETGAGQHGVATATAAALMGMECVVFMGEEDTKRQALNVYRMRLLGAEVILVVAMALWWFLDG